MAIVLLELNQKIKENLIEFLSASIHGSCCEFALALSANLDWPLIGLFDEKEQIIHVGVRSPQAKIWDGRGEISEEEFIEPFIVRGRNYLIREIDKSEIEAITSKHFIRILLEKAQLLWPDLSWKTDTIQDRFVKFAQALEEISREHGFWISGTGPFSFAKAYEEFGEEDGYELMLSDSGNFGLKRKLK